MMASYCSLLIVLAAVTSGSVRGQMAPAPAPAVPGTSPLSNSFITPTLASQLSASPVFGALKCYDALDEVYDQYTITGNWSQVSNSGSSTGSFYVGCHSYTPDNLNASLILLHPKLPVGKTNKDIVESGNTLETGAIVNIFRSAEAVGAQDHKLFFAQYPSSSGNQGSKADFVKQVVGRVILAKAPGGADAVCICGFNTVPVAANAPSQQNI